MTEHPRRPPKPTGHSRRPARRDRARRLRLRRAAATILNDVSLGLRPRQGHRHPRRLGLRQDDAAAPDRRRHPRQQRHDPRRRRGRSMRAIAEQLFALRRRLGMLFQFGALFTDLSVFDNVAFRCASTPTSTRSMIRDIVLMKLNAVGLRGAAHAAHRRDLGRHGAARRARARDRARPRARCCTTSRSPGSTRSRWRSPPT